MQLVLLFDGCTFDYEIVTACLTDISCPTPLAFNDCFQ
jgi:hypothetical protein